MYQLLRFLPECDDILIIRQKFRILVYKLHHLFRIVLRQEFQPCFLLCIYIVDYGLKCVKRYENQIWCIVCPLNLSYYIFKKFFSFLKPDYRLLVLINRKEQ